MKNHFLSICLAFLTAGLSATNAVGHGSPIHIDVEAGTLTTNGGLALASGFSTKAFDPSEDAGLDFPGLTVRTDLPGFDISGLTSGSTLQLEILGRHDLTDSNQRLRWLWYWDSTGHDVSEAENDPDFKFRRTDLLGSLTIDQFTQPAQSELTVSESITPDSHQHYLRYELDNSPAAAFGVYGVFARVLSPGFNASEPFLLAFAYGVGVEDYATGALAINRAAGPRGDYDIDGDVDGRDLLVWQRLFDSTTRTVADASLNGVVDAADLLIWQQQYGESLGDSILLATQHVPEPGAIFLAVLAMICLASQGRKRLAN
ncbi:hypothetical protein [Bythopirellula polymerisocia]|uniref:PEP-CTERM protein-sorting domain-containing protein n=1 Tax=Bythopirellula polymerisocia TaxID=2528003 RepID=A0A5C6CZW1_9BACT|nr:hypothetical protein [Bythopirellula polymerisocia]TWU28486.1 hypothetical protein Pla144_17760 [Bythopirellula polymerisocia]